MLPCFQDFVFFSVLFYLRRLLYTDIVSLYKLIIIWSQCVPKVLQYHVIIDRKIKVFLSGNIWNYGTIGWYCSNLSHLKNLIQETCLI